MGEEKDKRACFSADEKVCLKELVVKHQNIIECKKTDCISLSQKKKTWVQLSAEYNAISGNTRRTVEQLRKCWENMKGRRRKELTQEKQLRLKTGGGTYKPPESSYGDVVDDILDFVDIEMKDTIDSDTIMLSDGAIGAYTVNHNNILQPVVPSTLTEQSQPSTSSSLAAEDCNKAVNCNKKASNATPHKRESMYSSRGRCIERELEVRLRRIQQLEAQDQEIHLLRLEEQRLRLEEQRLKVETAKEQLKQEKLRTAAMEKNCI